MAGRVDVRRPTLGVVTRRKDATLRSRDNSSVDRRRRFDLRLLWMRGLSSGRPLVEAAA